MWPFAVVKGRLTNNTQLGRCFSPGLFIIQLSMFKATEKPFCRGIVPTIAFTAHALPHFHDRQMPTVAMAGILAAPGPGGGASPVSVSCALVPLRPVGAAGKKAICNALAHNGALMWPAAAQPATCRENKSTATAKHSQPSSAQVQVIPVVQAGPGAFAPNCRFWLLGDIAALRLLSL
jgi:hypothetical protein